MASQSLYIYMYIYICICVYMYMCIAEMRILKVSITGYS